MRWVLGEPDRKKAREVWIERRRNGKGVGARENDKE